MQAWQEELARSKRTHDVLSMLISILVTVSMPPTRLAELITPLVLAHFTLAAVSGLAVIVLALRSSKWYHERRCTLLAVRQLTVTLSYYLCVARFPIFDELYPIHPGARARMLLVGPAMIMNIMLSNVLPLHLKRSIGATAYAAGFAISSRRCAAEAALFPAEIGWYRDVLGTVDDSLRQWAPAQFDIINSRWPVTDAAVLSDRGACVAAHLSTQMAAMLVAVAVLSTDEALSRWLFQCRHALLQVSSSYGYRSLLALSLVMAVAEAYFGFYVILRGVQLAEVAWGGVVHGTALKL